MILGDRVQIKETGIEGKLVGIWHSLFGRTQFNVRYHDSTGRMAESWLTEQEIVVVSEVAQ